MGDLFHQSNANQSATNQQVGVSTRDTGGSVITLGAGVGSGGGNVHIETLDPVAINAAAATVHDAIAANTATNVSAFQAFQAALTASGETTGQALQLASSGAGSGASVNPGAGQETLSTLFSPSVIIWAGIALVGVILAIGYVRKH